MFALRHATRIWPRMSTLQLRRTLFIQTQDTPNENALKFVPSGSNILPTPQTPTVEIDSIKDAIQKSDLAFKLLSINNKCISSILLGYNFITVVRKSDLETSSGKTADWAILKPQIFSILTEHLTMGQPVLTDGYYDYLAEKLAKENESKAEEDDYGSFEDEDEEVEALIQELLTTRIQPAIQEDGGDIKFLRFEPDSGTVYLRLIGACKSCSSSEITLKNGIEEMLKYYIDEVKSVEQVLEEQPQHAPIPKTEHKVEEELPPSL